jgi:hypothetical protein
LSTHIISASVVMIGVATTLIGLVKVARAHMCPTRVDQFAGLAALLFLLIRAKHDQDYMLTVRVRGRWCHAALRKRQQLRERTQ